VIQGILVVRVFYMFEHSLVARVIIASTYLGAIAATIALEIQLFKDILLVRTLSALAEVVHLVGCPVVTETGFWHLYIPAFTLHSVLYIFTFIRVLGSDGSPQALLIKRLHRDGGYFYLVVIVTVAYSEIGTGLSHTPGINIPAVFANFLMAATATSVSRVMLSFHDLAEHLRNDPNRLGHINSIPLNRVNWRKGSRDGEFLVTTNDGTDLSVNNQNIMSIANE